MIKNLWRQYGALASSIVEIAVLAVPIASCGRHSGLDGSPSSVVRRSLTDAQRDALVTAEKNDAFSQADLGIWLHGPKAAELLSSVNTIPDASRVISVNVISQSKKLSDEADYYVELYNLNENRVVASVNDVYAKWSEKGIALSADLNVRVDGQVHAHYKPLATGVHMGAILTAKARVGGKVYFAKSDDPRAIFDATLQLDPTVVDLGAKTSIQDSKEVCWRIEYKCAGTWSDPIRTCEGKDCKIAWQYNIPISFGLSIKTPLITQRLPVQINIPNNVHIVSTRDILIDKTLALKIAPVGFDVDASGLGVRVSVAVDEVRKKSASQN